MPDLMPVSQMKCIEKAGAKIVNLNELYSVADVVVKSSTSSSIIPQQAKMN